MATKVVMAQLSPTMEEGKLVAWKVKEGDEVSQGDVLAEVETDKANMDIEAMAGGTVRALLISEGDVVEVGALIGVLGDPDEDISDLVDGAKPSDAGDGEDADGDEDAEEVDETEESDETETGAAEEDEEAEEEDESEAADETAESAEEPRAEDEAADDDDTEETDETDVEKSEDRETDAEAPIQDEASKRRVKVSPLARRMAEDAGLDIARIEGSGPAGRVVKNDVQAVIDAGGSGPEAEEAAETPDRAAAPTAAPRRARLEDERIAASQMRKTIAKRLVQSIGPVPHFFLTTEIEMDRALDLRKALNERLSASGVKVGVNDLLVKVAAEALARHPEINASWDEDAIQRHGSADIGIAVAVPDGLITPVVREADRKGLAQIATEASDLIERARNRKLKPEEYTGATFSISNLGMFGIDEFTAIINPPEAAILAVGQTVEKPVVESGEVIVRRRMRVTMSCDHRVIDGATGAAFLQTYRAMLENPLELVS